MTGLVNLITPTLKQRQAKIIADKSDFTLYGGAIRGGKTYWLLLMFLTYAFQYDKSRWLIIRESLPTLRKTILVDFERLLTEGFSQYVKGFNQQTLTVTFTNGSQIIFMAESFDTDKDLNRFRGLSINGGGADEINEIQQATFNKLIERSGTWTGSPGCPIKIIATCNPTTGWVKELIYDRWKSGTLPERWAYVPAKITDNPYIPEDYLISLKKNMPPYEYQIFVEGDWELQKKTGAEFYKEFSLEKHVKSLKYNPNIPLWLTIDENVHPYFSCTVWQIEGAKAKQINEFCMRSPMNTIKGLCMAIKGAYPMHSAGMLITGDATSQKEDVKIEKGYNLFVMIRNELAQYRPQLRVPASNPSVYIRGQFINTILFSNYEGIEILIDESCKETIRDFQNTKQAADGTKLKKKIEDVESGVRYEQFGHLSDCADYLITSVFASAFMKYQRGGTVMKITTGKNPTKHSY